MQAQESGWTWGSARRRSSLTSARVLTYRSRMMSGTNYPEWKRDRGGTCAGETGREMPPPPPLLSALSLVGLHITLRDAIAQGGEEILIGGHLRRRSRMSSSLNMEESSRGTGREDCNKSCSLQRTAEAASKTKSNHFGVLSISGAKRKERKKINLGGERSLRTRT
jgi:hypothetical protein